MKQEPKPKRSLNTMANLPKPAVIAGAAVILLMFILIIGSIVGGSGKETDVYSVLSDASLISSTSQDADSTLTNTDIRSLEASTLGSLSSQEEQIKTYLTSRKVKIDTKQIATQLDSATAAQLQTAKLNNKYDTAFVVYLKTSLTNYQSDLKKTSATASPGLKAILNSAYESNQVLLQNKLLK